MFDPSQIDVEDFLDALEINNVSKATSEEYRFSCPFPDHNNGDEKASAYMNAETTLWFCHGCHRKGSAVTFTADLLGVSQITATRMLREVYMPGFINPDARNTVEEVRRIQRAIEPTFEQPLLGVECAERFEVDWYAAQEHRGQFYGTDYIFERGFNAHALTEWEFGWDERSDRITFAVRDIHGRLIGFKGRAVSDERHPKYLVLGDTAGRGTRYGWPPYYTGRVVFGANRARGSHTIIVCEGELNAVAIWQKTGAMIPAVAINGSQFTEDQARIIREIADEVIIFFDSDRAGDDAMRDVVAALKPFVRVQVVPEHEGDPASMTDAEIMDTVNAAEPWTLATIGGKIPALAA